MALTADTMPHYADWTLWLFQLSRLVAQYHDSMSSELDQEILYRTVLEFDSKIRAHALPASLQSDSHNKWVRWARQEAVIVRANKIGFVHRRFFRKSLKDERYAYSRWASIEAARALIQEVEDAWTNEPSRPSLWNDQVWRTSSGSISVTDNIAAGSHDCSVYSSLPGYLA